MWLVQKEDGEYFYGYRGNEEVWDPDQAYIIRTAEMLTAVISSLNTTRGEGTYQVRRYELARVEPA